MGMALLTLFFALFGVHGSLRHSECSMLTFTLYVFVNALANIYVALRADGLWLNAAVHCVEIHRSAVLLRRDTPHVSWSAG